MDIRLGNFFWRVQSTIGYGFEIHIKRNFLHIWIGKCYTYFGFISQGEERDMKADAEYFGWSYEKRKWYIKKNTTYVIPCAGLGSRFVAAGYEKPKPLIDIGGEPMLGRVIDCLEDQHNNLFIYLFLQKHLDKYEDEIKTLLDRKTPNHIIVPVKELTDGAACTIMLAKNLIPYGNPTFVVNSDQFFKVNYEQFYQYIKTTKARCGILTFWADHPKWSYALLDSNNEFVECVVEKQIIEQPKPIINGKATIGVYYFAHGFDLICAITRMMRNPSNKVNNEWYLAPCINEIIKLPEKVVAFDVDEMYAVGTPEDLKIYLEEKKNVA